MYPDDQTVFQRFHSSSHQCTHQVLNQNILMLKIYTSDILLYCQNKLSSYYSFVN